MAPIVSRAMILLPMPPEMAISYICRNEFLHFLCELTSTLNGTSYG